MQTSLTVTQNGKPLCRIIAVNRLCYTSQTQRHYATDWSAVKSLRRLCVKPLPYSPHDLDRTIDRLTAVLEDEFGDDLAGWGAATLILLSTIVDMTGVDRQEIANHILQPTIRGDLQ
jgi:hypothetical protein